MLILLLIVNGTCVLLAALLVRRVARPEPAPAVAESFAAVLAAARPTGAAARPSGAPLWIPWHEKETRTC
jgi:hypothetical protein